MSLFALTAVAAANLRAPILLGFAFTSTISAVDETFGGEPLSIASPTLGLSMQPLSLLRRLP